MFFRTRFSASATTAFSAIVIARNTWPAAENYWLCFRLSHNRLATTGPAASNSLGSIRSSAPNAIVARWCASPSFPLPGLPQSPTPHEQWIYTPVFDRQSATNASPSASGCLSLGPCSSTCHFQRSTPHHFDSRQRNIPASSVSISCAIDEPSYLAAATTLPCGLPKHIAEGSSRGLAH